MSDIFTENKKKFQCGQFKLYFDIWRREIEEKSGKKGTSELFQFLYCKYRDESILITENEWEELRKAKKRAETSGDITIRANIVSKWLNGESAIQSKSIEIICSIFRIDQSVFEASLSNKGILSIDLNKQSRSELEEQLQQYCDSKNLSSNFVKYITTIPDIDKIFPFSNSFDIHMSSGSQFEITDDKGFTAFLFESELDILRDLQSYIEDYVKLYLKSKWRDLFEEKQKPQIEHCLEKLRKDKSLSDDCYQEVREKVLNYFGMPETSSFMHRTPIIVGDIPYIIGDRFLSIKEEIDTKAQDLKEEAYNNYIDEVLRCRKEKEES